MRGMSEKRRTQCDERVEQRRDAALEPGQRGRPRKLSESQRQQLRTALLAGPSAHGWSTDLWTLGPRGGARHHARRRPWRQLAAPPSAADPKLGFRSWLHDTPGATSPSGDARTGNETSTQREAAIV